ncbi:MAG: hypothetical protein ACE3JK_10790 [Sporolactobacillus sp.]
MKKYIIGGIIAILVVILCIVAIYQTHKFYFKGATDEYIAAQQIPKSRIIGEGRTWYNNDGGSWERSIRVKTRGEILNYYYTMHYGDKSVMLNVSRGRNDITSNKLEYPPLKHDK